MPIFARASVYWTQSREIWGAGQCVAQTLEQWGYLVDVRGSLQFPQHGYYERNDQYGTNPSLSREETVLRLTTLSTFDHLLSKPQLT